MSLKGTSTAASYMDFDSTLNKSMKMLKDKNSKDYKIAFLTICGIHFGLRISDLLTIRHRDMTEDNLHITEKKTGKARTIRINKTVLEAYEIYVSRLGGAADPDGFLFVSQKGSAFSTHQVNRLLQTAYGSKTRNISSHSLRKTFGRRVWDNDNCSERALIMLSKLFNHTSTSTTRIYLGIQQEELDDLYMSL